MGVIKPMVRGVEAAGAVLVVTMLVAGTLLAAVVASETKLAPIDGAPGDLFGSAVGNSVAPSGRTAVIGAHGDDDGGDRAGAAYIFHDDRTGWAEQAKLKVIVLSSFGDQYLAQAIEAGAKGYILKTATQPELVHAVVEAAAGRSPVDSGLASKLLDRLVELSTTSPSDGLSSRQQQILRLIADGVPSNDIAERVSISAATLSRTLRQIFNLLGVDNRAHAVAEAYKRKLL